MWKLDPDRPSRLGFCLKKQSVVFDTIPLLFPDSQTSSYIVHSNLSECSERRENNCRSQSRSVSRSLCACKMWKRDMLAILAAGFSVWIPSKRVSKGLIVR
ncbi:uncharacterized protein ASPGLDRAFT_699831 [Aspergillus glaucus CBS 516.65]|uniref:Uncharacterized protein n=1 Tax=Aspergillus glaucus CBS 516.65 TaxID=1160497 RepID=A0A1L9VWS2_ASPGL|nr:hypothetical protein ASPGLDRAFT_699831 [Aspergillus glaucus CBS 516.65]OJJ88349.1 hypothetical protein ASPGLDRAFT_699831 [Aspergillus glaucus CBS 516.65]